ncbi:response regulator receiver protein [Halorhabdus utahensis DSM 12940]|uniref:Response regulator receiver protein n=1 Tax=Halorhabdus utahensis (strain DSM 12940 / JCM 11049 / AX-2) TaxID=519442 RepID=C7NTW8_HALUD|nr:response regulator [Halorhabdus utahensis]ACV10957.1 response regulator receiver protein [Halorhabdus utahensis DSM 12940]
MAGPVSILVVEDDPDLRSLFRVWLADDDVKTVESGELAVQSADETVDVVLLDRDLPGIDGKVVARRLQAEGFQGTVAMVTGRDPEPAVATFPIDEYVTKPIERAELRAVVDRLSARREVPESVRTLFGLLTRRARLESTLDTRRLADSDEFEALTGRIDDQWATVRKETTVSAVSTMAEACLSPVVDCGRTLETPARVQQ